MSHHLKKRLDRIEGPENCKPVVWVCIYDDEDTQYRLDGQKKVLLTNEEFEALQDTHEVHTWAFVTPEPI